MKKLYCLLITVLLVMSLCACAPSQTQTTYTVVRDEMTFTVDTESSTIFDGTNTYRYTFSGTSSGYDLKITYPDGSTYWWEESKSGSVVSGAGGWSDDYDENRYVDGGVLRDVLEEMTPKQSSPKNILAIIVVFAIGIFNAVSPHTAWYLEYGWRYKNAEPSDMALALNRCGGVAAMIIAVVWFLV